MPTAQYRASTATQWAKRWADMERERRALEGIEGPADDNLWHGLVLEHRRLVAARPHLATTVFLHGPQLHLRWVVAESGCPEVQLLNPDGAVVLRGEIDGVSALLEQARWLLDTFGDRVRDAVAAAPLVAPHDVLP